MNQYCSGQIVFCAKYNTKGASGVPSGGVKSLMINAPWLKFLSRSTLEKGAPSWVKGLPSSSWTPSAVTLIVSPVQMKREAGSHVKLILKNAGTDKLPLISAVTTSDPTSRLPMPRGSVCEPEKLKALLMLR